MITSGFGLWYIIGCKVADTVFHMDPKTKAKYDELMARRATKSTAKASRLAGQHGISTTTPRSPRCSEVDLEISVPVGKSCRVEHDGIIVTVRSSRS